MAELSRLWETATGTGDSDTGGIEDDDWFQILRSLFSRTANLGGVSPDFQNELAVTGTSSPVAVNTGAALVYGIPYFNSASVNVAVATPAAQTRIDRIVLRADWTAQTVRITRIAGVEGGSAPAMTQTPGTTWDVPLATVSITTGGTITVTDAREWLGGIGDLAIDSTKLASAAVTFAKMQNINTDSLIGRDTASSGSPENIGLNATLSMDGSGNLQRAALTGDVTASAGSNATTIANDAVTYAKMQDIATDSLIGRDTASTGNPETIGLNATLSMDGSGNLQRAALTGDVTASAGSNSTTIANDAVTNAQAANMAESTIKGRASGAGTGDPTDLTAAQARTILNVENGADVTDDVNVGSSIHGVSAKTTPIGADKFPLIDTAASNVLKTVTLTNFIAAIGAPVVSTNTYTPDLSYVSGTTGVTYSSRSGSYVKINTLVFFQAQITLSAKGSGTGGVRISLPFTTANNGDDQVVSVILENFTSSGIVNLRASTNPNTSVAKLVDMTTTTLTDVTSADLTDSTTVYISGCYIASS